MPGGTSECEGGGRRETEPHGGTAKKPATDLHMYMYYYIIVTALQGLLQGGAFAPPPPPPPGNFKLASFQGTRESKLRLAQIYY